MTPSPPTSKVTALTATRAPMHRMAPMRPMAPMCSTAATRRTAATAPTAAAYLLLALGPLAYLVLAEQRKDDFGQAALVPVLAHWRGRDLPVHAVYPTRRYLSSKVQAMVGFLSDWFAASPAP